MKFLGRRVPFAACFILWFASAGLIQAQNKPIRLRNELIQTPPRPVASATLQGAAAGNQAASGLYLIQFTAPLRPAWTAELRGHAVELLWYVPEDAFVANLERTSLNAVRALPYVRWLGQYRPEHKIHRSLSSRPAPRAFLDLVEVRVLFSRVATGDEIDQVRRLADAKAREFHSALGAMLHGSMTQAAMEQAARSRSVLWIEPAPKMKLLDEISSTIVAGVGENHQLLTQQHGYGGQGVTVAVADSGLHSGKTNMMHPDLAGRIRALIPYGDLTDASDQHHHGTHVTGIIAGNGAAAEFDDQGFLYGLGVAPEANIVVQRIFDGDGHYKYDQPTFGPLARDAVRAGAEIGSNSWGNDTQGNYDLSAAEFDALVRDADSETPGDQPYILEFSAGNAGPGPQSIGSPAVAKNVITTGASQNNRAEFFTYTAGQEAIADFSSRGPCEDGRIKPDLVAPGTWIASLRSPLGNDTNAQALISDDYLYLSGTSQAGPHVSGAAALFVQHYRQHYGGRTPSPALVKAALINSAADLLNSEGTGPTPNMEEGWGRLDIAALLVSPAANEFVDQTTSLNVGEVYEKPFIIAGADRPLRITLAYTDAPGLPAAVASLINDLDLELTAPDGRVYRGNQFEHGESVPDAPGADNVNNVEGIRISNPVVGEYTLRVRARNTPKDVRPDVSGNQDFSLAISGDLPAPFISQVLLDGTTYTAPSQIKIKVIDLDQAGEPALQATIRSAAEPDGEIVILSPMGSTGTFTGSVATAKGPPTSDGRLQITNGQWIRAEYFDASVNTTRVAVAVADLLLPDIRDVSLTNLFGRTVIRWATDESARSVVHFGPFGALTNSATNQLMVTSHEIELGDLIADQTYYYFVVSTDAAGNASTNDNGGALFNFVARPTPTVLLVDAYTPDPGPGAVNIPLGTYTNALNESGVRYELWPVMDLGLPGFDAMHPYPIVIWRINDSFHVADTIPAAQQNAIQQYVESGGGFFMASMAILSRLGPVPFRSNVLQVASFIANPAPFQRCTNCDEDFGVPAITGLETDTHSIGIMTALNYMDYPVDPYFDWGPDLSDTFTPSTNAAALFFETTSGKPCGLRYPRTGQDTAGRLIFCSFPFDTIPESGQAPNTRAAFLRRVVQFLAPGFDGAGTVALSQGRYKLPDLVTVEVADSDLAGLPSATAQVSSDADPTPIAVTLRETTRRGVFRGTVSLASSTNPPAPGLLLAGNGQRIFARYFDQSENLTNETFAYVDAESPAITNLTVGAEFEHAILRWNTSEDCDALVQFGESAFLSRTVYSDELKSSHEIRLGGLMPDHAYYYRVVARDAAGNVNVADNNGEPFMFRTLAPRPVPFLDNLDSDSNRWSVFSSEDSQFTWRLGTPHNGVKSAAYSPPNAWGSTLLEGEAHTIDTYLISPAIALTGGNMATLRFYHSYDFSRRTPSDGGESGRLLIMTNNLAPPGVLAQYTGADPGWTERVFDLTPYVGQVIILAWHHQLRVSEDASRPGWLVDDVEITTRQVPPGVIEVSNNLAQARFTLVGPIAVSGQGLGARLTNMPPGDYVATFASVPFYNAPPAQTNTLVSFGNILFAGNYIFADANTNGISDAWELQYWGSVSRTRETDSDGDGATDYAEFIAGTDPTRTNSFLRLTISASQPSSSQLRFDWLNSTGRLYQLQGTRDFQQWLPMSAWLQTNTLNGTIVIPIPAMGDPYIFRLETQP